VSVLISVYHPVVFGDWGEGDLFLGIFNDIWLHFT